MQLHLAVESTLHLTDLIYIMKANTLQNALYLLIDAESLFRF